MEAETFLKILPDGHGLWLMPLTYGRASLVVGQLGSDFYLDGW